MNSPLLPQETRFPGKKKAPLRGKNVKNHQVRDQNRDPVQIPVQGPVQIQDRTRGQVVEVVEVAVEAADLGSPSVLSGLADQNLSARFYPGTFFPRIQSSMSLPSEESVGQSHSMLEPSSESGTPSFGQVWIFQPSPSRG